jgi:hypothetical protein
MVALTVVALACAPGIIWRTEDGAKPILPSASCGRTALTAGRQVSTCDNLRTRRPNLLICHILH